MNAGNSLAVWATIKLFSNSVTAALSCLVLEGAKFVPDVLDYNGDREEGGPGT